MLVGSIIHIKKYEVKKINIRNISFWIYLGFILIFTIYTTIRTFNTNDNFTNLFNFEQILMLIICGILGYIIIATLRLDLDKDRFYFVNVFLTIILIDLIRNNQNFVPIAICFLPIFTLFIKNKNIIDKPIGYGLALIDVIFIVNNQCEEQDCSSFIIAMIIFTVCLALNHVKFYEIAIAVFVLSFVYFPLLFTDYKKYYSPEGVIQGPSYYLVKNYRALGISKELYMYSYGSGISYTLLSCSPLGLCALAFFVGIKYKMKKYNNIILLSWILLDIISFSYFNLYKVEYLFMTLMFILLKEDAYETKDIIPFNSNVISDEEMARD